uniref:non-specific serine/threonine protein kinase n=1 Tax=Globodera rostochiensis TaxID=31243 RepID=A0A914HC90_GLORO
MRNAVIPRGVDTLLHIPPKLPDRLFETLYVGESAQTGLYALPAYVDEQTSTFAPKYLGPPLLEGPMPQGTEGFFPTPSRKRPALPPNTIMLGPTYITEEGEFLLLGYHHLPEAIHHLFPVSNPFVDINRVLLLGQQSQNSQKRAIAAQDQFEYASAGGDGQPKLLGGGGGGNHFLHADSVVHQQNTAFLLMVGALLMLIFVLAVSILVLRRYLRSYHDTFGVPQRERLLTTNSFGASSVASDGRRTSAEGGGDASWSSSRGSVHSRSSMHTATEADQALQMGWYRVNEKLRYDSRAVLGRGCDGTVVYRGQFDGRDVAVKRVQALLSMDNDLHRIIEREVAHLRESDSHPNVIRYFCSESDPYFSYIALELCDHTLEDFIKQQRGQMERQLKLEMLRQATDGIAHLHSIKIVHRDVKPKNILVNGVVKGPPGTRPRVKISDFGLCKTVKLGHNSISKVSGIVGTEGWMAPELFDPKSSVTYAVDVFSLGCVFYYVFTEGEHPFGDAWVRMNNIVKGSFSLCRLDESDHTTRALIETMLRSEATLRPTACILVAHPVFWEPGKQLQFLLEVSDRIEKLDSRDLIMRRLEWRRALVVGNWLDKIGEPLKIDLLKQRSYQNNVRDLLRAIRNKKHHYQELSLELRTLLGRVPDEYFAYFISKFPQLLMHSFMALSCCARESVFRRDFYASEQLSEFCERERNALARVELSADRRSLSPTNWRNANALSRATTPTPQNVVGPNLPDNFDDNIKNPKTTALTLPPPAAFAFNLSVPPPSLPIRTNVPTRVEEQQQPLEEQVRPVSASPAVAQQPQPATIPRLKTAKEKAKKLANKRKKRRKAPFTVLPSPVDDDDDDGDDEEDEVVDDAGDEAVQKAERRGGAEDEATAAAVVVDDGEEKREQSAGWETVGGN